MSRRLRYLLRRPLSDQVLIVQTLVLLGVTRLLINTLTFKRLEPFLGERLVESPQEQSLEELSQARRIAWAIRLVSPHTPWESNCFPQAVTAKLLLRRRRIGSTLYLGARFAENKNELMAHAWLRCGPLYLTGGDSSDQFGAIASFA